MKNAIFIHAANMGVDNYGIPTYGLCQDILNRIIYFMDKSSIYSNVDLVHLGYTGEEGLKFEVPKANVTYYSDDVYTWEFPTLNTLREYCKNNPDANVAYLHTQGISQGYQHPKKKMLDERRDYHLYWNVYKHGLVEDHLKHYDTYGAMLVALNVDVTENPDGTPNVIRVHDNPIWHYSQNFWWARAEYINTLPDPSNYPLILDKRHQAEFWACSSTSTGRHKAIHSLYDSWCYAENFNPKLYMPPEDIKILF